MENMTIAKQMLDFQKSTFDSAFDSLTIVQQQMGKMIQQFFDQSAWFPAEGKAIINQWGDMVNKGRYDFKEAVDNNYKKWEEFIATGESAGTTESTAKTDKIKMSKATI